MGLNLCKSAWGFGCQRSGLETSCCAVCEIHIVLQFISSKSRKSLLCPSDVKLCFSPLTNMLPGICFPVIIERLEDMSET